MRMLVLMSKHSERGLWQVSPCNITYFGEARQRTSLDLRTANVSEAKAKCLGFFPPDLRKYFPAYLEGNKYILVQLIQHFIISFIQHLKCTWCKFTIKVFYFQGFIHYLFKHANIILTSPKFIRYSKGLSHAISKTINPKLIKVPTY